MAGHLLLLQAQRLLNLIAQHCRGAEVSKTFLLPVLGREAIGSFFEGCQCAEALVAYTVPAWNFAVRKRHGSVVVAQANEVVLQASLLGGSHLSERFAGRRCG